ncbi:Uncharacterised protein [Streptococcus suis]|uniref:Uncharacterized protein n=1 Tax=Streptococcus suis TaxID=1307 RepID=A0A116MDT3_STRSU|nr:Uncharacterised protein [Streptococcus suis]
MRIIILLLDLYVLFCTIYVSILIAKYSISGLCELLKNRLHS